MLACPASSGHEVRQTSPERTAAWGLAIWAAARTIAAALSQAALAALVAQVVLVEYGTSRLGVTWTEKPGAAAPAKRAAIGAGAGLVVAAAAFAVLVATGGASIRTNHGGTAISVVGLGLLSAALTAVRDELLLHGLVLRIVRDVPSIASKACACGVASAGAHLAAPDATVASAVAHALLGTALGAVWLRDRGAWMAFGAHGAWLFTTGTLLRGALRETDIAASAWAGGRADLLGGWAAVVTLAPVALAAVRAAVRARSQSAPAVG